MKKLRVVLVVVAVLLTMGLVLAGAEGQKDKGAAAPAGKKYVIYYIVSNTSHPFYKVMYNGAMAAGAIIPDVEVKFVGSANYDFESFIQDVETAVGANPDGIILIPYGPEALDEPLGRAKSKGIPVIQTTAKDIRPEGKAFPYLMYLGEPSYDVGVKLAKESLARYPKPQKAVFAIHQAGNIALEQRASGYIDTLKKAGIPVDKLDVGPDPVKGAGILIDYLKANPTTQLVYPGSTSHIEAFIALAEAEGIKVGKDIVIPCIDLSTKIMDYIEQGKVMFTLDQQQWLQAYLAVQFMYTHVKYAMAGPAEVGTGPAVVSKENVATVRALVAQGIR
jgi:simple sugar transport system substrate-binding protein